MSQKPTGVTTLGTALLRPFTLGREYSKVWGGQTLSALTDNITAMALSILVLQRTGSATKASVGLLLQMIPALILGPLAGVILDRAQRKGVLVVSDISRTVAGLLAAYALHTGSFGLIHVYGWMTLSGIVRAFYDPATNALIPTLVSKDSIQPANAMHTLGKNTAMILGPAIGGFALSRLGGRGPSPREPLFSRLRQSV